MHSRNGGYVSGRTIQGISIFIALFVVFEMFGGSFGNFWQSQTAFQKAAQDTQALSFAEERAPKGWPSAHYALYFDNTKLNSDADCKEVFPTPRPVTNSVPEVTALHSLFGGPSETEKAKGYTSFFSEQTALALRSISIRDGVAAVNMADIRSIIPNVSSSCGSQSFIASVQSTLEQFGNVRKVIFAIDGSPQEFYDWVQLGCSAENDYCDNSMFR